MTLYFFPKISNATEGEAVHAVMIKVNFDSVYNMVHSRLPEKNFVITDIDFQGARLFL